MDYARFTTSRGGGRGGPSSLHNNAFSHSTLSSRTPAHDFQGSRTPLASVGLAGGRTPAWGASSGARTPAWSGAGSSARTPAWQQSTNTTGSRTPAYAPTNDGSRTVNPYSNEDGRSAYGGTSGGGGRTPAWNPVATPSSFSHDVFGGGSGGGGGGGRTPAYEPSYSSAGDSRAGGRVYDAPTPAASAPTPGASNGYGGGGAAGQTPQFSGDAPTPFGGGLPETPGWSGGDAAGPRYEEGTPSP